MAPALLGLAAPYEGSHGLEDLIKPPHFFTNEVLVIDLEEPMISFVFLERPVSSPPVLGRNPIFLFPQFVGSVFFPFRSSLPSPPAGLFNNFRRHLRIQGTLLLLGAGTPFE